MKRVLSDLLNWLNGLGTVLLAYALANPSAASDLLNLLPDKLKTPAALMLPAAWFMLVQFAKAQALRKAAHDAP